MANYGSFVFNLWMFYITLIDISGLLNYMSMKLNLKGLEFGSFVKPDECIDECEWIKIKILIQISQHKLFPKEEIFQAVYFSVEVNGATLVYTSWGFGYTPLIPDSNPEK